MLGVVLQDPADNLLEYLRAGRAGRAGRPAAGRDPGEAAGLLDAVGLGDRARSYPAELSGGEQQRVAFAAAAVGRPACCWPTSPPPSSTPRPAPPWSRRCGAWSTAGASLVVSSHDPAVIAAADDVVWLRDGEVDRR